MTKPDGKIDEKLLADFVKQCAKIRQKNDLLIVTSGAMGCGRTLIKLKRHDEVTQRQLYAVVGQVKLMTLYADLFAKKKLRVAQMLVTKDDFHHRVHFLNTKNCVESLFKEKIIPIMNENDFIAIDELMFTDNDELASMVANVLSADRLIVLTNVDGVLDEKGKPIPRFEYDCAIPKHLKSSDKSSFGKGGIQTKFKMAQQAAKNGIGVIIANSREKDVVLRAVKGEKVGTYFVPKS